MIENSGKVSQLWAASELSNGAMVAKQCRDRETAIMLAREMFRQITPRNYQIAMIRQREEVALSGFQYPINDIADIQKITDMLILEPPEFMRPVRVPIPPRVIPMGTTKH